MLFSARVDSTRLREVNRKNLYLWRSGDLCLQSTEHKFHFIVLIKNPFDWKSHDTEHFGVETNFHAVKLAGK